MSTTALTGFRLSNISIRWVPIIAGAAATAAVIVTLFTLIRALAQASSRLLLQRHKIGLTDSLAPGGMSDLLASTEIAFRAVPQSRSQPAPRYWRVFCA